jgi:hypothetical protein
MTSLGVDNAPTYPDDHFDLIWSTVQDSGLYKQTAEPADCTFPNATLAA